MSIFLIVISFLIVAFGQPLWGWWLGLIAASVGFALFWRVLLDIPRATTRFWLALAWYGSVQLVQTIWMTSHPFMYIYAILLLLAAGIGAQFGALATLMKPSLFDKKWNLVAFAAAWVLLEWSRLYLLSGYPLNPAGLSLTGLGYPLQLASIGGVYLLSFWVFLTNLFFLRLWWLGFSRSRAFLFATIAVSPYLFGFIHYEYHYREMKKQGRSIDVLLIQSGFQIQEELGHRSAEEMRALILKNWKKMFKTFSRQMDKPIDLIVFPEYVISYGTYYAIFPAEEAIKIVQDIFGAAIEKKDLLPPLEEPYAMKVMTPEGERLLVNNAFFAQTVANLFNADVAIGLGDTDKLSAKQFASYSAAFHFAPNNMTPERYEKRVLVPGGEYIPLSVILANITAQYGIRGALTSGEEAKVFSGAVPFGLSICYEEMYGHLMRENRQKGAELLVNLTNDAWFPHSTLPQMHFDHARLRTVENGIPLVRACNTGVTGAIDSLGSTIGVLGDSALERQLCCDSLLVRVPTYHYNTLYSSFGDWWIVSFSALALMLAYARVLLRDLL